MTRPSDVLRLCALCPRFALVAEDLCGLCRYALLRETMAAGPAAQGGGLIPPE